jgi:hypothetical protein
MYLEAANIVSFSTNSTRALQISAAGTFQYGLSVQGWSGGTTGQRVYVSDLNSPIGNGGQLRVVSTTAQAVNVGGSMTLGGCFNSTTSSIDFIEFAGRKENGTAGNADGYALLATRSNSGGMVERTRWDSLGNMGLNVTTFGSSAAGVFAVKNGTAPSTGPADTVQLYSSDLSAGNTIPSEFCEGSGVTGAGITSTTVTHKIARRINGTVYYLLATTNGA